MNTSMSMRIQLEQGRDMLAQMPTDHEIEAARHECAMRKKFPWRFGPKTFYNNGLDPLPLATDAEIEIAKRECERRGLYEGWRGRYRAGDRVPHHEHPDCIRMAFAWLDGQRTVGYVPPACDFKHLIEDWANRYVSRSDVMVAAYLHPRIEGAYPCHSVSNRLIMPDTSRLAGLEANIHGYTSDDFSYFGYETTAERCRFPDVTTPTGEGTQAGVEGADNKQHAGRSSPASSIVPEGSSDGNVYLAVDRPSEEGSR